MPTIVSPNLYFAEGESILAVMERIGKVPNLEKITMNKEGETLPLNTVNTYPARRFFKKVLKVYICSSVDETGANGKPFCFDCIANGTCSRGKVFMEQHVKS